MVKLYIFICLIICVHQSVGTALFNLLFYLEKKRKITQSNVLVNEQIIIFHVIYNSDEKCCECVDVINECMFNILGTAAIDCSVDPKTNEARLRKNLFCSYDKTSRPILTDGPISVKVKMIVKAFDFESLSNKLTVSSWLAMVCSIIQMYILKCKRSHEFLLI